MADTGEELSAQAKALATYQLYLDKTAKAQGDAVRTSASFANMLKRLQGTIKDTFANAGQDVSNSTAGLLGTMDTFIQKYGGAIISGMISVGEAIGSIFDSIGEVVRTVMEAFGLEMQEGSSAMSIFGDAVIIALNLIA